MGDRCPRCGGEKLVRFSFLCSDKESAICEACSKQNDEPTLVEVLAELRAIRALLERQQASESARRASAAAS